MNRRQFIKTVSAASLASSFMAIPSPAQQSSTYLDYLGVDLAKGAIQSDLSDLAPFTHMEIGGVAVTVEKLPKGLKNHSDLGVVMPGWVNVRAIHRFPQPDIGDYRGQYPPVLYVDCPRPVITPQGDYLLSIISGRGHYGGTDPHKKVNDILIYRSKDKGATWQGPFLSTNIPYNQHAWVPLVPRSGKRIYMFSTEPAPDDFNGAENAGIGFRHSDDDGYTWSGMTRIRPVNDPGFQGMWCINMTETDRGTWLLAPHEADWTVKPVTTHLYALRSTDQGRTWELLPGKRPEGWQYKPLKRMDEGRPLALGHGKVVLFARTPEGHIWQFRSADDGKTWSEPRPTPLVHPDAPPMIEKLSDRKTLIALHHNRLPGSGFSQRPHAEDRSELWVSLSKDDGLTWTEPRFLAVTSTVTTRPLFGRVNYCMTYCDVLADAGNLHIFIPHLWRQVLEVRMREKDLMRLPTKSKLFG
jgi:hypothetical protein